MIIEINSSGVPADHRDANLDVWYLEPGMSPEYLGFIPMWVYVADDTRSMVDLIDANYAHGGGWRDFDGFTVNPLSGEMTYPDDPIQKPLAMYNSGSEVLWFYDSSWVTVLDTASGKTRTARID